MDGWKCGLDMCMIITFFFQGPGIHLSRIYLHWVGYGVHGGVYEIRMGCKIYDGNETSIVAYLSQGGLYDR